MFISLQLTWKSPVHPVHFLVGIKYRIPGISGIREYVFGIPR
jgi:hypothetical protein